MLITHYVYCMCNFRNIYSGKVTNKIIKVLSVLKKFRIKMGARIENLINAFANDRRTILYTITMYLLYLIPILRWMLIISIFTTKYEDDI